MIFSMTKFEDLPDEILLLICRYLSSTEILFSFNKLNSRLCQTISDYSRHVVLGQIPFKQFNILCQSILPEIGSNISSLVISNDWKGVLSTCFLNYFANQMSSIFPKLQRLILTTFVIDSLMKFLLSLENLPNLIELKIASLYEMGVSSTSRNILLQTIFNTNNSRLQTISIDDDSLYFSFENITNGNYLHITKLTLQLDNLNDLHRLLTCLRQLEYLDVETNNEMIELNEDIELIPIITLKYFRLRSLLYSWTLTELLSIFPRIPNVKELIIQISTDYDLDLIHGDQLYEHLSKFSLDKFMFFLQIHYPSFVDPIEILSTWKNFSQEFLCFKTDDERSLVLYSLPFHCPYLILRCSVAKNPIFNTHFGINVKCLTLFEVSSRIAEIFPIILKCYRMRCLVLQISSKILPQSIQEIQLRKMPFLTFFVALQQFPIDLNDFKKLLEVSTNLYHFALNYEVITPFLNDNNLCELLGYRMTDLLIGITTEITSESMVEIVARLACVCPSLRHLYFHFKDDKQSAEALILSIFTHLSQWKRLISFGVANIQLNSTILSKGIRQWVLENCNLSDNDSFLTDYSANTFRLWL